jgi:valacyclovir hydrolase
MPFAETTTGARLHYVEYNPTAAGAPIIGIHGLLGTAERDLGGVLQFFAAQGYRVLGLTLRGYGESSPKPRDFPLNFYHRDADDVLAFMDALQLEKAHLLGFSDGGETVLCAAGKAPQRVVSVTAWGAVGSFGPELRPVFQRTYPGHWIKEEEKQLHGITDADAFTLAWVLSTTRMIDAGGDVSLSMASGITAPVLILLGRDDTLNPETYGRKFVDAAPNGRLVMLAGGHACHTLHPQEFCRIVGEFIAAARERGV